LGGDPRKETAVSTVATLIRRGFIDVSDGQMHYRHARPIGARADSAPLIVLHPSPGSSLMMTPFIRAMAEYLPVYAFDTRGNGDSDPLPGKPTIPDFAAATWETIDALNLGTVSLLGTHTGASIATEAANQRPQQVSSLIIDNMGLWSDTKKTTHFERNSPNVAPDAMGSQLNWAWHYCRDQYLFSPWYDPTEANRRNIDLPGPHVLHDFVVEVLKALGTYHMSYSAAAVFDKRAALAKVSVRTLVSSNVRDPLMVHLDELHVCVRGSVRKVVGDLETEEGAKTSAALYAAFLKVNRPTFAGDLQPE
jgi:pimeloyl-ACP methyl ester carboxylesterase